MLPSENPAFPAGGIDEPLGLAVEDTPSGGSAEGIRDFVSLDRDWVPRLGSVLEELATELEDGGGEGDELGALGGGEVDSRLLKVAKERCSNSVGGEEGRRFGRSRWW